MNKSQLALHRLSGRCEMRFVGITSGSKEDKAMYVCDVCQKVENRVVQLGFTFCKARNKAHTEDDITDTDRRPYCNYCKQFVIDIISMPGVTINDLRHYNDTFIGSKTNDDALDNLSRRYSSLTHQD